MHILEANNISVTAWQARLVNNVSLQLAAGEMLAIIGPNGAGKSTLLNSLAGGGFAHQQTQGDIIFDGLSLSTYSAAAKAKSMAFLPQFSTLNFPFTVEEVIQLARIPHSTGSRIDDQIIQAVLHALDIDYLKQRPYTQLSGGERQRAQIARVMAQIWRSEDSGHGRVLLLDEPTSSLDLGHQQQLMQALRSFADQGVGILMVAHDINLVAQYADRVLALCCGEAVSQGAPTEVVTAELMKTLYQADVRVIKNSQLAKPVVIFNH